MRRIYILIVLAASRAVGAEPHRILFNRIGPYETALYVANADGTDERPPPGSQRTNPGNASGSHGMLFMPWVRSGLYLAKKPTAQNACHGYPLSPLSRMAL